HMALALENAAVDNAAAHEAFFLAEHLEIDQAVVDSNAVADAQVGNKVVVVDGNGGLFDVLNSAGNNGNNIACAEVEVIVERAGTNLRALRIHEYGYGTRHFLVE